MNKRIIWTITGSLAFASVLVVLLKVGAGIREEPAILSCAATPSVHPTDVKRYSTPLEAVRAEIELDVETPPTALKVIFSYPDPDIHDVRVRAKWGDRSEVYGVAGADVDGAVEWLARGPLEETCAEKR